MSAPGRPTRMLTPTRSNTYLLHEVHTETQQSSVAEALLVVLEAVKPASNSDLLFESHGFNDLLHGGCSE